ncbi:MAG: hypothetical protein EBT82_04830 [Micrococcales bacterium]|nr:hypothetical protein [Micrococcales bacterium]NBR55270.1 hypothetical protein [Micrococcales bacterium]
MPLKIEAILSNSKDYPRTSPSDFWVMVSGVTPGSRVSGAVSWLPAYSSLNIGSVTAPEGYAIGSVASRALVPITYIYGTESFPWSLAYSGSLGTTAGIVITDTTSNETTVVSGPLFVTTMPSAWTINQDSSKNCNITCTSIGAGGQTPFFISLSRDLTQAYTYNQGIPAVFNVELSSPTGLSIYSSNITAPADGALPFVQVPSASITTTGKYTVQIKTRYAYPGNLDTSEFATGQTIYKYQIYPTVLTAPTSAVSAASIFSWLNSDYWNLTDLQVNVATRDVTSRRESVTIRPNDTINFAVLFHNGSSGVDPIATEIKIAARNPSNNGPYALWSAATVTTVAVSGDTYYSITVTASDDDLLSLQSSSLLSGSNAGQSLIAEVQWTTTRGTFSSDTFTINAPNEVIRESDI